MKTEIKRQWKLKIKGHLSMALLVTVLSIPSVYGATVATVNEIPIELTSVNSSIQLYLKQIGHKKLAPSRMVSLQKEVLTKLIEEELLYQKGLEKRLVVSEEEVEAGIIQVQIRFSSTQVFNDALSKEGLSITKIREGVRRSLIIQKVWKTFLQMTENERINQLKMLTEKSVIRIHEAPLRTSRHH